MREIMHVLVAAVVVTVAAVCTLVQLSDADRAMDNFNSDRATVQQMSSAR